MVLGSIGAPALRNPENFHIRTEPDLSQDLQRFWELEELSPRRILSSDETCCEEMFEASHQRDASGRYTIWLSMRQEASGYIRLDESYNRVMNMYLNNEKRQSRDYELKKVYMDFMWIYAESYKDNQCNGLENWSN